MGVCFVQFFDLSPPKAPIHDPMAHNYFVRMKNIFLGTWQNIHNSASIGVLGIYWNICARGFWILNCYTFSNILSHTFTHSSHIFHIIWANIGKSCNFWCLKACTLAGESKYEIMRVIQPLIRVTGLQKRGQRQELEWWHWRGHVF